MSRSPRPTRRSTRSCRATPCIWPNLAWHIGNRHLAAAIRPDRIFILRDHVIKKMLKRLGAAVNEVLALFDPVRGAYSGGHDHGHDHEHHDHDHHDHGHHDHDHTTIIMGA